MFGMKSTVTGILAALGLLSGVVLTAGLAFGQPTAGSPKRVQPVGAEPATAEAPTEGTLLATGPGGEELGPCPLEHTDVRVEIVGFLARVTVTQKFHNPFDYKIEGVYTFPLSQNAAVDDMTMVVGDRVVRGVIKPREEARDIYEQAKAAGRVASLLDQERTNIFTQSVANIEPGDRVDIEISYVETLDWEDGTYHFDFPMVVGPRYMPGAPKSGQAKVRSEEAPANRLPCPRGSVLKSTHVVEFVLHEATNTGSREAMSEEQARACLLSATKVPKPEGQKFAPWHSFTITYADGEIEEGQFYLDGAVGRLGDRYFRYDPNAPIPSGTGWAPDTDQVPDASRISPPVVPEGMRAGHDISIAVRIDGGLPIHELTSEQHEVTSTRVTDTANGVWEVTLAEKAVIPNKDFVLTWSTASAQIEDTLLTHYDERGGYFMLILQPPQRVEPDWIVPKEMIFVIDKSGSMSGFPIETAKKTMRMCIQNLNPDDTFNLMTFAGGVGFCFDKPVSNTDENRSKALQYLQSLQGGGGTEMMKAIEACLGGEPDSDRVRIVCFMTDGYVGNDMAIVDAVRKNAGETRVFSFGIGRSVNRYLLDGMAHAGRGEVEYVLDERDAEKSAEAFYERVTTPVLTDIVIDWGGLPVRDLYPALVPDLFSAKPVVVVGRFDGAANGVVELTGQRGREAYSRRLDVSLREDAEAGVIATLWARRKVEHLMNQDLSGIQRGQPDAEIKQAIVDLGMEYRLLTQYTSFVAVEEMTITRGGEPVTLTVPVEMPEGVSHEGVFGGPATLQRRGTALYCLSLGVPTAESFFVCAKAARSLEDRAADAEGVAVDAISVIQSDDSLSAEEKRERVLKLKLADALHGLAGRVGDDGCLEEGDVKVVDGKLEVAVYLHDASEETLKALKELGLEVLVESKTVKLIIGRIAVDKLDELALHEAVRRVGKPAFK